LVFSKIANGGGFVSSKVTLLQLLSKPEYYDLIVMVGDHLSNNEVNLTPDYLRKNLNLTKREFNSRIEVLMSYELVDMVNNQYILTTLGNDAYDSLRIINIAIKMNEKFHTNNKDILDDITFLH